MTTHLSLERQQLALQLRARGLSLCQIGPEVGCSRELVRIIASGSPSRSTADPEEISPGPACGGGMCGDRGPAGPCAGADAGGPSAERARARLQSRRRFEAACPQRGSLAFFSARRAGLPRPRLRTDAGCYWSSGA